MLTLLSRIPIKRLLRASMALLTILPLQSCGRSVAHTTVGAPPPAILAERPPLGWNSWDSYSLRITEDQFRANIRVLVAKLQPFGYDYGVIDEGWFLRNPEVYAKHPEQLQYELDSTGRYIPVPSRFPSARVGGRNIGFASMSAWMHAQGLKFGIHIVRGIPRESVRRALPIAGAEFLTTDAADQTDACPWDHTNWGVKDNAAGQAWYDALLRQYAEWGVDFLKVDCISNNPYKESEIRQIRTAMERSGRPMVLSLSPGPTALEHASQVTQWSQMWRISNDIWDIWDRKEKFPQPVKEQFERSAQWSSYAQPGHWPDADMLPIGELRPYPEQGPGARHTRLTPDEQRTLINLWAFARSPLIVGANLTLLDAPTLSLLTNREILNIDQNAVSSRESLRDGNVIVWTARLRDGRDAVAVFNIGESEERVNVPFTRLGLAARDWSLTDAWDSSVHHTPASVLSTSLRPHASIVMLLAKVEQRRSK